MTTQRPCLYCTGDGEKTREHVLQGAFGVDVVLANDVCGECNTQRFAALDGHLVNYVRQLARVGELNPSSVKFLNTAHPISFDEESRLWTSIRIAKDGNVVTFPQFIFTEQASKNPSGEELEGQERAVFTTDISGDYERQLADFKADLAQPDSCKIAGKVVMRPTSKPGSPWAEGCDVEVQSAVIQTGRRKYCVRARSQQELERWMKIVRSGRFMRIFKIESGPQERRIEQPRVHGSYGFRAQDIHRAIAKTALNSVCDLVGPEAARDAAFDALRIFVLNGQAGIEQPFVSLLDSSDEYWAKFVEEDNHSIIFVPGPPSTVVINLYGKPFAAIDLDPGSTKLAGKVPQDSMALRLFWFGTGNSEIVRMYDDPLAFGRRFGLFPTSGAEGR